MERTDFDTKANPAERNNLTRDIRKACRKEDLKVHGGNLILLPKFLQETDVRIYQVAKDKDYQIEKNDKDKDSDQRYPIGDNHIAPGDIILIGTVQVSHGSWMPILQLNNGYALCLGI
jgi:hypothetical protein